MINLLFSAEGRVNRAKLWLAGLIYMAGALALVVLLTLLWQVLPGDVNGDTFHVEGVKALPYLALVFGYVGLSVWSGICVAIKRFHDRGKSGAWVLIQLVPVVGPLWFFVEAGCLRGTVGPNQYGPDPLDYTGGPALVPAE